MVRILGASLALSLFGAPALAAGVASLQPAIGNVIVSTHPDGRQAKLWLKADQTYRAKGRKGEASSGVWKVKGAKLCLSQKKPYPIPFPYCSKYHHGRVGEKWADKAFNGEPVTNQIVPG